MDPRIVEQSQLMLVGIVGSGAGVGELDIHGMWERLQRGDDGIKHQVPGAGYELHVQLEADPPMHFCMVAVEVTAIDDVPTEMFAKVLPAHTYAVFTHRFGDGGFGAAYERIDKWLRDSDYTDPYHFDLQRYDSRFKGIDDPDSVVEIYVPIERR
jgi:predicted transcriptional regulator YdeE